MFMLLSPLGGVGGAALGLLFLICFYLLCLISVLGIKYVVIALSRRFINSPPPEKSEPVKKPKRKPVKSIVIDPDEIDKIVVKKGD